MIEQRSPTPEEVYIVRRQLRRQLSDPEVTRRRWSTHKPRRQSAEEITTLKSQGYVLLDPFLKLL